MFSVAAVPVIAAIGCGVDYSIEANVYAKLTAYADAAVLSAVNKTAMTGSTNAGKTFAIDMFNAQAASVDSITAKTVNVSVTDSGLKRTAVLDFTATMPTTFMGVVGQKTVTMRGAATATSSLPTYIDFYILLDNTPSMGVGATPADVTKMVNNTSDQCAFACHDLNDNNNYYKLAKSLGVTTRIDVVRSATQSLMDTATATQSISGQFRMAIYTFGASAATASLTTITPLTSSLSSAKTAAQNIDLMTVQGQNQFNDQDTNFTGIMPAINLTIPAPGDGATAAQPQKVMFFVSDGVADELNPGGCSTPTLGAGRCQQPMNVALCTAIKNRNIKIAVLYTTYLPLPTNNWWVTTVKPWEPQIARNMESCASPGLYFEVSPTQGISDAMNALFQKAVATARLAS